MTALSPNSLDDARALQAAAAHIENRYPGMASLMRRCATRLYQSLEEADLPPKFAAGRWRSKYVAVWRWGGFGLTWRNVDGQFGKPVPASWGRQFTLTVWRNRV